MTKLLEEVVKASAVLDMAAYEAQRAKVDAAAMAWCREYLALLQRTSAMQQAAHTMLKQALGVPFTLELDTSKIQAQVEAMACIITQAFGSGFRVDMYHVERLINHYDNPNRGPTTDPLNHIGGGLSPAMSSMTTFPSKLAKARAGDPSWQYDDKEG